MQQENPDQNLEPLKRAANCKYREYIRETLAEYQRRGNYIRIYPAKGSDMYDPYFNSARPFNKAVYKALFTDEVLKGTSISKALNQQPPPEVVKKAEPKKVEEQK
jgi:hypothetical protein